MLAQDLLKAHPIITDQVTRQELIIILGELEAVLNRKVCGDIVEFGCYAGTTSLFLQRLLQRQDSSRQLYLYDSFKGLPAKGDHDHSPAGSQFIPGSLAATKSQLITQFKKAGLPVPSIKKAWFNELSSDDVPAVVAFAFLDGDFYDSIKIPLQLIEPKLTEGSVVIIDDYQNEALPGAAMAVDEWLLLYPEYRLRVMASLAVLSH